MKKRFQTSSVLLLLAAVLLIARVDRVWAKPTLSAEALFKSAEECQKNLYASKEKQKYRHNWILCIERFQAVAHRFPQSEHAPRSLFLAATMHSKLYVISGREQDLDEAVKLYRLLRIGTRRAIWRMTPSTGSARSITSPRTISPRPMWSS